MSKLDVTPGWKTYSTAAVTAVFNLLRLAGYIDFDEETTNAINTLLGSAIATFLGLKIERNGKNGKSWSAPSRPSCVAW